MTIRSLIRKLEKAEKTLGPRAKITVDLRELKSATQFGDGLTHWELNCFDTEIAIHPEDKK